MSWQLRARAYDLTVGSAIKSWTATLVENLNTAPDSLIVTGPYRQMAALLEPGSGCLLADQSGVRFSGISTRIEESEDECSVTFASDLIRAWRRVCFANPAAAWTAQVADFATHNAAAETVALTLLNQNLGPGALAYRRSPGGLTIPTSAGRGPALNTEIGNDILGNAVASVLKPSALRVNIVQAGTTLAVTITDLPDKTQRARYGTARGGGPGRVESGWKSTVDAPTVNAAMVAGGPAETVKTRLEVADAASQALWADRVEQLVSISDTSVDALTAAGQEANTAGANPVDIDVTIPDLPNLQLGTDVPIGSLIGLNLRGRYITERVRQITTVIGPGDQAGRSARVGSDGAGLTRDQKRWIDTQKRLHRLELA